MPRAWSSVCENAQLYVLGRSFQLSFFHELLAGSPDFGTDRKSQAFAPVRASKARTPPGDPFVPTISRFLYRVGAELYGAPMSISPFLPNAVAGLPGAAFSAISRRSEVTKIRGGAVASPGQYVTPRREGAPFCSVYRHVSLPVSGSSATTRSAPAT